MTRLIPKAVHISLVFALCVLGLATPPLAQAEPASPSRLLAQNDTIIGAWTGVGRNPNDPAQRRADTYRIDLEGSQYVVTLTGVEGQKPYSFFGNFFDPPVGQVVFKFFRDGEGMIHGTYHRHYRDPCFSRQVIELSGSISPDHKSLRLRFKTEEFYESQNNPCNRIGPITWEFDLTKTE